MKRFLAFAFLLLLCLPTMAQTAPSPDVTPHGILVSELGFRYHTPEGWEPLDLAPMLPNVQKALAKHLDSNAEAQAAACMQYLYLSHHAMPPSMELIMALPYACYKIEIHDSELSSYTTGITAGVSRTFDAAGPVSKSYQLNGKTVFILRTTGQMKEHPEFGSYTLEIVSVLLKKGLVVWMGMAQNETELATFEHTTVELEGGPAVTLVPDNVFGKQEDSSPRTPGK
jgi:hypothetical protein